MHNNNAHALHNTIIWQHDNMHMQLKIHLTMQYGSVEATRDANVVHIASCTRGDQ